MALYELLGDRVEAVPVTSLAAEGLRERSDLQRLLRDHVEVIDEELLILAEEFGN